MAGLSDRHRDCASQLFKKELQAGCKSTRCVFSRPADLRKCGDANCKPRRSDLASQQGRYFARLVRHDTKTTTTDILDFPWNRDPVFGQGPGRRKLSS